MVREQIKNFRAELPGVSNADVTSPATMCSVLLGSGKISDPYISSGIAGFAAYESSELTLISELEVTPLFMSMKYLFIEMSALTPGARLSVNGRELFTVKSYHKKYSVDVKTALTVGKNEIKLVFPPISEEMRVPSAFFGTELYPRLADVGIHGKLELVGFNHKRISSVRVRQTHAEGSVRLDLFLDCFGYDDMSRAVATLISPAGNVYFCGFMNGEGTITVSDPNFWYPIGLGMQSIYKLNINLYSDAEIEDAREMNIGLCDYRMSGEGDKGHIEVNGVPLFPMGTRFVASDIMSGRADSERLAELVRAMASSNVNTLYFDPTGTYPSSQLLDLLDTAGIMAIAELPHSRSTKCDGELIADELRDFLKENAYHPSLGVASAREELFGKGAEELDEIKASLPVYDGELIIDLKGEISSRLSFIGTPSLPTYDTVERFAEPADMNLGSLAFELHGATDGKVLDMLAEAYKLYKYPDGTRELSYISGLSSAFSAREQVSEIRKRRDGGPLGVIVGTLTDPWAALSDSMIDYYGGKKPLYYIARDMFMPVRIMAELSGTRVRFILSNSSGSDYYGVFTYAIMTSDNKPVFRDSFPIKSHASSNMDVHTADIGSVIRGHLDDCYISYSISDNANYVSRCVHLFTKPKRFAFKKPDIKLEVNGVGTDFEVSVTSGALALGVELSLPEIGADFEQNYFDITSSRPVKVRFKTKRTVTVEKVRRLIKVRSFN